MNKLAKLAIDLDVAVKKRLFRFSEEKNLYDSLKRCRTEEARQYVLEKFEQEGDMT